MDINVLDYNFNLIAIVDTYQSLIWCKRYNDIGALDLQIEATNETLSVFKKGNYITRNDDDAIYRIEAIELDTNEDKDNSLIVGAYDIKKILNQRIVYDTETYNTTVENAIRGLINNNFINPNNLSRKINNFALKNAKGFTELIQTQITYDVIGEKINELCKTYNYGYKLTRENGVFYFDLFKGVNRSINQSEVSPVVFSPEYDNLVSSKYNLDISEIKNVALVGGEGEGKNRKKIEVGTATGLDRFEMFVDSSGVSSNEGEITDSEYYQMLIENGKEQLAQNSTSTSFEGVVDTNLYEYKKDFDLGDIVTLENEYGIKVDARIIEIIETWNDTGYSLEPKFEYMEVAEIVEPQITDALTTEASVMMLSERGVALLSEDSTSVMGVKISELEQTTELKAGCCLPVVQDGETKKVSFETIQNNCIYDDSELKNQLNQEITDRKNADTDIQKSINTTVNNAIAEIVANSPEDFNTLKEISDWIDTHEDSASAMNTAIQTNKTNIDKKVDKVSGKGLSTNDYTTTEKNKLAGIATGANKTVIDSALSSTSTNPVQNKVIYSALSNKADKSQINGQKIFTCTTVNTTAAKTLTIDNFVLEKDVIINVLFSGGNQVTTPSLNINETGAKSIVYNGVVFGTKALSSTNGSVSYGAYYWSPNTILRLRYNGQLWLAEDALIYADPYEKHTLSGEKEVFGKISFGSITDESSKDVLIENLPFTDTNYNIQVTCESSNAGNETYVLYNTKTTSSVKIRIYNRNSSTKMENVSVYYRMRGY
jgi:hypothetical protein